MPVILGAGNPQYTAEELEEFREKNEAGITYEGKHYTLYEASQRQRRLETSIRNYKRRILIDEHLGDKEALQNDQVRLVRLWEEYNRFSKAAGLPMQHERMEAAGFTWKLGKAAEKVTYDLRSDSRIASAKKIKGNAIKAAGAKTPSSSSWDASFGVQSWNPKNRKAMHSAEYETVDKKYEITGLYDGDGNFIFKKNGDSGAVNFTQDEIKQMRGGVLTHNHPNGSCFSPEDINMLRRGKLLEIRAVTSQGVYRLQKPAKWGRDISNLEKIDSMYYNIDNQVSPAIYAKAARGEITYAQAEVMCQETVLREFAARHGLKFDFDSWDDIRRWSE